MVSGIQIIGIFFGLILTYFTYLHFKREEFSVWEFLGWEVVWVLFILIALFPGKFGQYSGDLGAIRPMDLFTVLGFIVVLSIAFYTYINVDRLRKRLEKAIRDLALQDLKEEKKKNDTR